MRKFSNLKASVAPMVLGLAMVSTPAFAQDQDVQEADTATGNVIVVTGSRISNPNLELSSPVGVVTSEELELRQTNTAEQFLRELPSAIPSIGSAVNNGNGGSSFVNLRGIGANRNLVLLDGRRFVPATVAGITDLNAIPLAVIERTDILTGGASTTYGADAISGVVNFITKRDFAGIELNASQQITEEGDGNVFRTDLTIGANFDDGRGNVVLSVGYQDQDAVFQGDRDFGEFNISSFSGEPGGSSNAIPAVIIGPIPGGFGQIAPDGQTVLSGVFDRPFNFNPFNIFQTPFERFNIYSSARYEINENVELYSQAVFSKNKVETIIAPGGSFFNTYQFNLNNPTIPDGIANQFCAGLGLTAAQCTAGKNTQFGPTLPNGAANPDYVQFGAQVRRRTIEAGTRNSEFTTTLFNIVVGARGAITDNIDYDVSASYGESERFQRQSGFARRSRLDDSLLALPNGTCISGNANCAPINLFGLEGDLGSQQAIDYVFSLTQQVINTATIATVNGTVTGDLGFGLSASPISFAVGGEYRKFTADRQSDSASQTPGAVVGGGGAAPDVFGSYNVYDAFGELAIPVFEGESFAESLTIDLGARYSDYSTAGTEFTWKAGGTWEPVVGFSIRGNYQQSSRAPNIGELFLPIATNLSNLQTDPCQGAAPTLDANLAAVCIAQGAPAAVVNAGGILPPAAGQINFTSGGNTELQTETAKTWTVGFIAQPTFIPGFSLSVDYFNIVVEDAISVPTVNDVLSRCFDGSPSVTDPFCVGPNPDVPYQGFAGPIRRNPTTGGLDGDPSNTPGLILPLSNSGRIATDGIDVSSRYQTPLTDDIGLAISFDGTWTNKNTFQATPTSINRDCIGLYSVNCGSPQSEFAFTQRTTFDFQDTLRLSLLWRYKSEINYEPIQFNAEVAAAQADPTCPDPLGADTGGCVVDPEFRSIPAEHYFDLSFQWDVSENVLLTLTAQNLFDNKPKLVGSNIGSTAFNSGNVYPSSYDALGRRYGASVKFTF